MCLFMYFPTAIAPPVGSCKWKLLYKQMMNDNVVKHCCNNTNHAFRGESPADLRRDKSPEIFLQLQCVIKHLLNLYIALINAKQEVKVKCNPKTHLTQMDKQKLTF